MAVRARFRAQGRGETRKAQRWRFQFRAMKNFLSKFVSSLTKRSSCNVNYLPIFSTTSIRRTWITTSLSFERSTKRVRQCFTFDNRNYIKCTKTM